MSVELEKMAVNNRNLNGPFYGNPDGTSSAEVAFTAAPLTGTTVWKRAKHIWISPNVAKTFEKMDVKISESKPGVVLCEGFCCTENFLHLSTGQYVLICPNFTVSHPKVGPNFKQISIGSFVIIGSDVVSEADTIESYTEIGHHSIIQSGVIIRSGCVIAPHTVLVKNTVCAPNTVWAGNPGQLIRSTNPGTYFTVERKVRDVCDMI